MPGFLWLNGPGTSHCSLAGGSNPDRLVWRCPACGAPRPKVGPVDIQIEEFEPEDSPITFLNGIGLSIVRTDLLKALGSALSTDLNLGTVRNEHGIKLGSWASVTSRREIIVRGTKEIGLRHCETCGRNHYFAMGRKYLYPEPPHDAQIFRAGAASLVVRSSVSTREALSQLRGLRVDELSVLAAPKDGLGELSPYD